MTVPIDDPTTPAEDPAADPTGTETPPEPGSEDLTALDDDDLRDLGRALASPAALEWARAELADEGDPVARETRYRREAREAQTALTAATEHVERLQRAEVLRLAGAQLAQADDLLTVGGAQLSELLDDDGHVDRSKVDAAAAALIQARPGLQRGARVPPVDFGQGVRGEQSAPAAPTWSSILNPSRPS